MFKNLFFSLAIGTLLFSSCKKDDENNDSCIQTDFVGTYSGTNECEGQDAESVTFTIVERNGDLYLSDSEDQEYPIETNGCTLEIPSINLIFAEISGTGKLEGNKLTVTQKISVFGVSSSCKFEGNK